MMDFTDAPRRYMAAGPRGEPREEERAGLVLHEEVLVVHRGTIMKARIRGFCEFTVAGVCFCYTPDGTSTGSSTSYWIPIGDEGIEWVRGWDADGETRAAMNAMAVMG